jgi:hypothetical protein
VAVSTPRLSVFALALLASLLLVSTARAVVTSKDPGTIIKALQDAGYRAELGKDQQGDPKVKTTMAGLTVNIMFYGCTDNESCGSFQFVVSLDSKEKVALARANDWNRKRRWGAMFLDDEGDPVVTFDVDTTPSGIDEAVFKHILEHWEFLCNELKQFTWGK